MTPRSLGEEMRVPVDEHLHILRRRFASLAELVERQGGSLPAAVEISTARNGMPTAAIRHADRSCFVHSTFNPLVEAQRWAQEINTVASDFIVVVGLGLGYHVEALVDGRPWQTVVVIEPTPDLFVAAMLARDQRRWLTHPRLDMVVTVDAKEAATWLFMRHRKQLLNQAKFVVWPATSRYATDFVSTFNNQLLDLLRAARVNLATSWKFSTIWIENFFTNLDAMVSDPGIESFLTSFRGRPGIIVAAGPSLERNEHLLTQAKGRAVMIAAGSAINPLLKRGIQPDLLVSVDPGEANYRHFEHLRIPDVPLVYVPTIFSRIVQEYVGPRFVAAMDRFPFIGWFLKQLGQSRASLASGPSVANVAWDLALKMGLNPIVLVGQDLAYTNLRSHAEGAVHRRTIEVTPEQIGSRYFEVESVDGGTVLTDRPMNSMKFWFEDRISHAPQGHITIDATEGGAKIRGTKIMSLQEVIETYCIDSFDPHVTLLEIHRRERERVDFGAGEARLQRLLNDLAKDLKRLHDIAAVGVKDGKHLLFECETRRLTEQRYRDSLVRLERLMRELAQQEVFEVVIRPLIPHILESVVYAIQTRWQVQVSLQDRGRDLARQYLVLFGTVKQMSWHVQQLVATTRARRSLGAPS